MAMVMVMVMITMEMAKAAAHLFDDADPFCIFSTNLSNVSIKKFGKLGAAHVINSKVDIIAFKTQKL